MVKGTAQRWFKRGTALVLSLALVKLLLHLLTNGEYGFHRDEFYYIAGGLRPDWGYVDHPPITPLLAGMAYSLFGTSISGLRLLPAVAGASIVFFAGVMARQMGGGRTAQGLAAFAVLVSPLYLLTNTLFQTVTFDQLAWVVCSLLLLRLINEDRPQFWVWIGLVIGIGLQTKYTILLWALGLVVAVILTDRRSHLQTVWPWLGGLIALTLFLPNLIWQVAHGWPSLEFIANNSANAQDESSLLLFFLLQLPLVGPFSFPLLLAGLYYCFSSPGARYRAVGWIYVIIMILLAVVGGKPYYSGPLYPVMLAAGAVAVEHYVRRTERWYLQKACFAVVALNLLLAPLTLPVVPKPLFSQMQDYYPSNDFAEMFGWQELTQSVARAYRSLPPEEQAQTIILASSYGAAGALELHGPRFGLPGFAEGKVFSGHNSYYFWGPPDQEVDSVIAVGFREEALKESCAAVKEAGVVTNRFDIRNEEAGRPIYLCRGLVAPMSEIWPLLRHFQ